MEISDKRAEIAVIGLGNAGLPLAAVIADRGMAVLGVDINEERCRQINQGANPIPEEKGLGGLIAQHGGRSLIATTDFEDARGCKSFIVIVPLLVDESNHPDFSIMEKALQSLGRILKKGDLVVLETTFPGDDIGKGQKTAVREQRPCRGRILPGLLPGEDNDRIQHLPAEGVSQGDRGADEESGLVAYQLYRQFISNLHLVSSASVAEMTKVMEGCYRDVNIALANELYKICQDLGVDFFEAREMACHQFCHIHLPSTGVGDTAFLSIPGS